MRKIIISGAMLTVGLLFGACSASSDSMTENSSAASSSPTVSPVAGARTITGSTTEENRDGSSTVVTNYSDGSMSETRTFKNGRLIKVTRQTNAAGTRAAYVTYRADGKEKELKDPSWIEKSMEATAEALVEVADKAEDVGDATKKGAREVADKAEDVGDAAKKGAKKAGRKIKDAIKPE